MRIVAGTVQGEPDAESFRRGYCSKEKMEASLPAAVHDIESRRATTVDKGGGP